MLTRLFRTLAGNSPHVRRTVWKFAYQYLARSCPQDVWRFMNYGYAPLDSATGRIALAEADEADRYCIQLYHEVANAIDLSGLSVLEVGCGRGGGAAYIARYLGPSATVGVDFSKAAIDLCRSRHTADGLSFVEGDAEHLPFDNDRFDVVVNVESSHCYGDMNRFLSEVRRVLKPGGRFLFADLRGREATETLRRQLEESGMVQIEEADITANVMRALDLDNDRKKALIPSIVTGPIAGYFEDFAGIKGLGVYRRFWNGENVYLRFVLRKSHHPE